MADPISAVLFAEDRAHEAFLRPLLRRLAHEANRPLAIQPYSARGGRPRVFDELRSFQTLLDKGAAGLEEPDFVVVAIDANCAPWHAARKRIVEALVPRLRAKAAVACPDPHVERWFMADPASFEQALGRRPRAGRRKCERARYKSILAQTIREAGYPAALGGLEFAEDIVSAMDLYRAGKNEKSLRHFVDAARSLLAG
jgi:hypothetical protein